MDKAAALSWLDDLIARLPREPAAEFIASAGANRAIQDVEARLLEWYTEACQCIQAYAPTGTVPSKRWAEETSWQVSRDSWRPHPIGGIRHRLESVLKATRDLIAKDRLETFEQKIQANTVIEVVDQSRQLAAAGYLAAATVLAGGALETHLAHLCQRAGITPPSPGSIEKYRGALDQARKAGNEIVSQTDCKQLQGWGGRRNDAAHTPTSFDANKAQVDVMIDGITAFISKYT